MHADTVHTNGNEPKYARINDDDKSFCADAQYTPTLGIEFDTETLVVAIHMKGHPTEEDWVTEFEVEVAGNLVTFPGNVDNTGIISRQFYNNVSLHRVFIKALQSHGDKCMRVELFGINDGKCLRTLY